MGITIQTNITSSQALRSMASSSAAQDKATRKLSSGSRITQAGDDAAGLSIASRLTADSRSMAQALRNAQEGVSLIQVTEGALQEVGNILIRLRELGIQASSDTIGNSERSMLNREVLSLRDEVERIANSTEFNGKKVLNGGGAWPTLQIQTGINSDNQSRFDITRKNLDTTLANLGLADLNFSNRDQARESLSILDGALDSIGKHRASLGALQNALLSNIGNNQIALENSSAARSRISDADIAEETSELTKQRILNQSAVAVLSQANQSSQLALKLLS